MAQHQMTQMNCLRLTEDAQITARLDDAMDTAAARRAGRTQIAAKINAIRSNDNDYQVMTYRVFKRYRSSKPASAASDMGLFR